MYNEEKDTFDLSRVPGIHDMREYIILSVFFFITLSSPQNVLLVTLAQSVQFDMLHNPYLGLTETLHRVENVPHIFGKD
jgi:hypothetical protein